MRKMLGLTVSGLLLAALVAPSPAPAQVRPPGRSAEQPPVDPPVDPVVETERGVVVTLASGDRLAITASRNYARTTIRRFDAATATWGDRGRLIARRKHLSCGDVEARTAGDSVALTVLCEKGSYAEDQAPTHSQAMISRDGGRTWSSYTLPGEAYDEPGIAPAGQAAVWPRGQGRYTTWLPDVGFTDHRVRAGGQEYTMTTVVDDDARVTYVYGRSGRRERCTLVFLSRTGEGPVARQVLPLGGASCGDEWLANRGTDVIEYGDLSTPVGRWVITRPRPDQPFVVTAIAPSAAPGLRDVDGALGTRFFHADGLPIQAVGGRGGGPVRTQRYDPLAQRWEAPIVALPQAGCRWDRRESVTDWTYVALLRCRTGAVALASTDGVGWAALPLGGRVPVGVSPDRHFVALPAPGSVSILSRERGIVTLPYGTRGRCDIVVPGGPDTAGLLTSGPGSRGWPARVQRSGVTGWVATGPASLPRRDEPCWRSMLEPYVSTLDLYVVTARRGPGYGLTLRLVDGAWVARKRSAF